MRRQSLLKGLFGKKRLKRLVTLDCNECGTESKFRLEDVEYEETQEYHISKQNIIIRFLGKCGHEKSFTFTLREIMSSQWTPPRSFAYHETPEIVHLPSH